MSRRLWPLLAALACLVLVATDLVPALRGPAPYPPEWRWELRQDPIASPWPAVVAAAALVGLVCSTFRPEASRAPLRRWVLLGGTLAGCAFSLGLLSREPGGAVATLVQRTASRTITSYHTVAISPDAADPLAFLRRHAELLPELRKPAKHAATHPPGPVLFHRALLGACRSWPAPCRVALQAAGLAAGRDEAARAAALFGPLLVLLACAATVWPLAALGEQLGWPPGAALRVALLWPLLPGPALMAPQFDQALAFPVAGVAALLAVATGSGRRGPALLAGLLAGAALLVSYGALAFVAVAVAGAWAIHRRPLSSLIAPAGAFLAGILLVLGLLLALGHRPLDSLLAALAIHREFYTAPRSHLLWIPFNLVDLGLFLGAPVAAAGLLRLGAGRALLATAPGRYLAVVVLGVLALDLTGSVRGEVGRIWIPLMALLLPGCLAEHEAPPSAAWTALLGGLLAALCLVLGERWLLG